MPSAPRAVRGAMSSPNAQRQPAGAPSAERPDRWPRAGGHPPHHAGSVGRHPTPEGEATEGLMMGKKGEMGAEAGGVGGVGSWQDFLLLLFVVLVFFSIRLPFFYLAVSERRQGSPSKMEHHRPGTGCGHI